jgi:YVTN family beta-propeller protein
MTSDRPERDLDAALGAWMRDVAPASVPVAVLEGAFGRTMAGPQARVYPWERLARRSSQPRRLTLLSIALAAALLVGVLGFGVFGGGSGFAPEPSPSPSPTPSSTAVPFSPFPPTPSPSPFPATPITPTGSVAALTTQSLASDGKVLWALSETGSVARIDPATNTLGPGVQTGGASDLYNGISVDTNGVWVTDWDTTTLFRIDPTTLTVSPIEVGPFLKGVLATGSDVWVAATHDGNVYRIDPATNTVVATITVGPTGNSGPNWLGVGFGSIWVSVPNASAIVRIDPLTDAVAATIKTPVEVTPCGSFAFTATDVWTQSCGGQPTMARIDPATNTVAGVIRPAGPVSAPVMINGSAWVSIDARPAISAYLARLSPDTDAIDVGLSPSSTFGGGGDLVVAAGSVWVIDGGNARILRLPLAGFPPR